MAPRFILSLALSLVCVQPSPGAGQTPPTKPILSDTIHGRVTTDSAVALPGADVIVTMVPSTETLQATTGAAGEYLIAIPNGSGEYVVYIGALGRKPYRRRLTRVGARTDYIVDAHLGQAVAAVAVVKVEASRVRPSRAIGSPGGTGTDGTDKTLDGVGAALPPELTGNLDAMGSLVPGIASTPNGLSAFGLGAGQNQTSLNGLSFASADLPRDARTSTRFQLSPWDPAIGGFAGAAISVTLLPGDNVAQRRGHLTVDQPTLQISDALAARTGQEFSRIDASEGGSGPLRLDEYFYNYGLQISRTAAPVKSLADLDAATLVHAGLSVDSAARILQTIGVQGIPIRGAGVPANRTTTSASFIERIDHSASSAISGRAPSRTWSLAGYGRYALSEGTSLTATTTPDFAGRSANASAGIQGISSTYFGPGGEYLNETTTGVSVSSVKGTPFSRLPTGVVGVASAMPDGSTSLASAAFGGNGILATDVTTWNWEAVNQTSFQAAGRPTLPMHLYLQSRLAGFSQSTPANRDGRFDFASIEDLAANKPSSYSRALNTPNRSGGEWIGAAALGGAWTKGRVVLTGGARADANVFLARPTLNADVSRDFGVRNDRAPSDFGLSPRLGFNWYYHGARPGAVGSLSSGPALSLYRGGSQLRGGIGEFRAALPATLLSDAIGATGLPGSTRQLRCVGTGVPVPAWQDYERDPVTIPERCADGSTARTDSAPSLTWFDRSFTAPRTWKSTVGWTTWNDYFYLALDATYAMNEHLASDVDLNFSGDQRFRLSDEANRPVFAPPSAIVSGTGATTLAASRRFNAFGAVTDRSADLRSSARQLTAYAIPSLPLRWGTLSIAYTYIDTRAQARGFDQSTAGDPRAVDWAQAIVPRHQLVAQMYHYFLKPDLAVTMSMRAASGLPFTPLVAGDVNGDGVSNDRAFVFDPAATADTSVANAMRRLLVGSGASRDCLERQLGQVAGRASCASPWSATMNAGMFFGHAVPGAHRAKVSIDVFNVLAGADQLLHGSNLHGWGVSPLPDPTLLRVRGFDAARQRFLYDVNGRFGQSSQSATLARAPFRITVDVAIDLGRSAAAQHLEQNLRVRPGLVGTRAPADTIKKRYLAAFQDIYGILLRLSDSLALSADQIRAVEARRPFLLHRADSIYTALTSYLATLSPEYDGDDAVARVSATGEAAWQAIYDEAPFLKSLLNRGQIRRLPGGMNLLVTVPNWRGRFALGP